MVDMVKINQDEDEDPDIEEEAECVEDSPIRNRVRSMNRIRMRIINAIDELRPEDQLRVLDDIAGIVKEAGRLPCSDSTSRHIAELIKPPQ